MTHGTLLSVTWQLGWKGDLGENGCIYMYGWILSLFAWNYHKIIYNIVVVQLLSRVRLLATAWTAARQAFLSFTISRSLLKLMFTESVMPFSHLILLPSIFPGIKFPSNESALILIHLHSFSFFRSSFPCRFSSIKTIEQDFWAKWGKTLGHLQVYLWLLLRVPPAILAEVWLPRGHHVGIPDRRICLGSASCSSPSC